MGFIREKYANNQGGLTVSFQGNMNTDTYFAGDNVQEALQYFQMYLKNNQIFIKTEEEKALETIGISSKAEAEQFRSEVNNIVENYTDEQALDTRILFPKWVPNKEYTVGTRVRYSNRLYKVLQNHISQEDWTPTRAPSLFAQVLTDEENNTPQEWQAPSSTNPYMYGDRVIFRDNIYESIIDFNVWSPIDYPQGWQFIETIIPEPQPEPTPDEPIEDEIPEWSQPDSTNSYNIGDRVRFNGSIYESVIDNNIWSPADYPAGWTLVE